MNEEQQLTAFLSELLALLEKYENARLSYTTKDDGIHAWVGDAESKGFWDRDDLRKQLFRRSLIP